MDYFSATPFSDPDKKARDFLKQLLDRSIREKIFDCESRFLCSEALFAYADMYEELHGWTDVDTIILDEVERRIREDLPKLYALKLSVRQPGQVVELPVVGDPFGWFATHLEIEAFSGSIDPKLRFHILRMPFVREILHCIGYLKQDSAVVSRPYRKIGFAPIWLSDGFDEEKVAANLSLVLRNASAEYFSFLKRNGLLSVTNRFDPSFSNMTSFKFICSAPPLGIQITLFSATVESMGELPHFSLVDDLNLDHAVRPLMLGVNGKSYPVKIHFDKQSALFAY